MPTLAQMLKTARASHAEHIKAGEAILAKATSEDRDINEDEETLLKEHTAKAGELNTEIETMATREKHLGSLAAQSAVDVAGLAATQPQAVQPAQILTGQQAVEVVQRITVDAPNWTESPVACWDQDREPGTGFGDYAMAVHAFRQTGHMDKRLNFEAAITGGSQKIGSDGGFLVPPGFAKEIWDGVNQVPNNLFQFCDVRPIPFGVESMEWPANAETSRVTGSRFGGVQGYWIAEADEITKSKPTFRKMRLEPQGVAVLIYQTDKLLMNAPSLEAYLSEAASQELSWLMNNAIVNGSGAGQPVGFLGHASVISIAKETGQAAATVVSKNIDKMYARNMAQARTGAVWLINQDVEPQLEDLNQAVGTGGQTLFRPAGGITDAPHDRLKNRPIIPIEYAATLGTVGDISLVNLKFYALGVRGGIKSAQSMHLRFQFMETAFRFSTEIDGQPWLQAPQTPANGTNTLSPMVTLATRS